jgi:FkbM family methyltransferase
MDGPRMPKTINTLSAERAAMAAFDMLGFTLLTLAQTARPAEQEGTTYLTGLLEIAVTQCTLALQPSLVIEIGAHAAGFSRKIKREMEHARVIAFEANPDVHARHAALCAKSGVEYNNLCVSDKAGVLTLHVPLGRHGAIMTMGSILAHETLETTVTHEVPAVTLDAFLAEDIGKPKAIWLDVEGAAGLVLDGAPQALESCVLLYAELETARNWGNQRIDAELVPLLARHGLVPVLRDTYRATQYNALFLNHEALSRAPIMEILCRVPRKLAMVPATPIET